MTRFPIGLAVVGLGWGCSAPARLAPTPPAVVVAEAAPSPSSRSAPATWLRGSTHVHAAPSGDSATEPDQVLAWYQEHGYDFIFLTDHNRVTTVDTIDTVGKSFIRFAADGLIVFAGVELTHNPTSCDPPPPAADGKCRIHVNVLGPTARPAGKLDWVDRLRTTRVEMYGRALDEATALGGVAQLNHPQWHWGMTSELLAQLTARGATLIEIANVQFPAWNAGGDGHPSTEALWDAALTGGATLWGLASDDAHHYQQGGGGRYPAGGGWIMVDAPRDPDAILQAIKTGRFYASTGVALSRAGVWEGALEIEIEVASAGERVHRIVFVGTGGKVLREVIGPAARFPLTDVSGYLRAVVVRDDGARAWTQPIRP